LTDVVVAAAAESSFDWSSVGEFIATSSHTTITSQWLCFWPLNVIRCGGALVQSSFTSTVDDLFSHRQGHSVHLSVHPSVTLVISA